MARRCFVSCVLTLAFLGSASADDAKNQFPESVQAVLDKADQIEVLSLDPWIARDKIKNDFHGTEVLGKTVLKDAEARTKLVAALTKGVKDKKGEVATAAFYPRYAIRATQGKKTVDLLISLDDSVVLVYVGDAEAPAAPDVFTTKSARPLLDAILRDAKVPQASKPGKK